MAEVVHSKFTLEINKDTANKYDVFRDQSSLLRTYVATNGENAENYQNILNFIHDFVNTKEINYRTYLDENLVDEYVKNFNEKVTKKILDLDAPIYVPDAEAIHEELQKITQMAPSAEKARKARDFAVEFYNCFYECDRKNEKNAKNIGLDYYTKSNGSFQNWKEKEK